MVHSFKIFEKVNLTGSFFYQVRFILIMPVQVRNTYATLIVALDYESGTKVHSFNEFLSARSSIADLGLAFSVRWRRNNIFLKCGGCHVLFFQFPMHFMYLCHKCDQE